MRSAPSATRNHRNLGKRNFDWTLSLSLVNGQGQCPLRRPGTDFFPPSLSFPGTNTVHPLVCRFEYCRILVCTRKCIFHYFTKKLRESRAGGQTARGSQEAGFTKLVPLSTSCVRETRTKVSPSPMTDRFSDFEQWPYPSLALQPLLTD